jgi:hypothetical protein
VLILLGLAGGALFVAIFGKQMVCTSNYTLSSAKLPTRFCKRTWPIVPKEIALRQAIAAERARLFEQLWKYIVALRQMVAEAEQPMNTVHAERPH